MAGPLRAITSSVGSKASQNCPKFHPSGLALLKHLPAVSFSVIVQQAMLSRESLHTIAHIPDSRDLSEGYPNSPKKLLCNSAKCAPSRPDRK